MLNVQLEIDSSKITDRNNKNKFINRVNIIAESNKQAIQIVKHLDPEASVIMIEYSAPVELDEGQNFYVVNDKMKAIHGWVMKGTYHDENKALKWLYEVNISDLSELDEQGKEELEDAEFFCGDILL
jgi:hypothetical protein